MTPRNPALHLLLLFACLALTPAVRAEPSFRSAVVALGLWSDPVFKSEATGAAAVVAARYGHGGRIIVRANSPSHLVAGPRDIGAALVDASRDMDPKRDILFLILTSHGSPEGIAERGGGREGIVPPDQLSALLVQSPVVKKVLIVSACFAGIYTGLANPDTLVITAADAQHASFGCVPEAHWTYFGDAFFNQALRRHLGLRQAFAQARALVGARESAAGFEPSNPQIAGGENVLATLDETP